MPKQLLTVFILLFNVCLYSQSFISTWNTANTTTGSSGNNEITIPTNPAFTNYNYTVDWGDGTTDTGVTGNITHTYAAPNQYTIAISGVFPSIYFNDTGDRNKIIEIIDWGTIQWETMENAFFGCENINFDAIDAPDLSQVTSLKNMFRECTSFNGILNGWDVSTITDISGMFAYAEIFNRPLDLWNTINITDMSFTFDRARRFNEPLDNWNTSSVVTMEYLFSEAGSFDQNINNWDVSQVTNMTGTFRYTGRFDSPLNNWIVTNVTNMSSMFQGSAFNQPLSTWVVDNVTNMSGMFRESQFNQPIEIWNVSNVTDMSEMFMRHRTFNHPLNNWDVSSVTDMSSMFSGWAWDAIYNQPLNLWDVSNVTDMSEMFRENHVFNQDISDWNVSNVTNMSKMFQQADSFNQDISSWVVDNVTDMSSMFRQAAVFNQPLDSWNVPNVENMSYMFYLATSFNQPLNSWDVDNVTNMANMFAQNPVFDQALTDWNTGVVVNMSGMFQNASAFNQNLALWDVSSITNMATMLSGSGLSQANYDNTLIGWAAQSVNSNVDLGTTNLNYCDGRIARQELIDNYNWNITGDIINCSFVLCTNLVSPLNGDTNVPASANLTWAATPGATGYKITVKVLRGGVESTPFDSYDIPDGNTVGLNLEDMSGNDLLQAGDEVSVLIVPYNNTDGDAVGCTEESFTVVPSWVNSPDAFKLTYDTRITDTDTTPANQLKIETNTGYPDYLTYNYSIDWGDDQFDNNVTGNITHTYLTPGIYTVSIIGDFPAPLHNYSNTDNIKLTSIDQWGTQDWQSMNRAFYYCENMVYNATDTPNLSNVESTESMFSGCRLFNGNIDNWDVSNVTNMSAMFIGARTFDQPLNSWNVGNVTNMSAMFLAADAFDQPLNNWNTSNVLNMSRMFENTDVFNQNLNIWTVDNVTNMAGMFDRATLYNQPMSSWIVSNVTDMSNMFKDAEAFNQPIGMWNVGNVTDMSSMFSGAEAFDQVLNNWNVEKVTSMSAMFNDATIFNQALDQWDVGLVTNMATMFNMAGAFNQNIDNWNVTNVIDMRSMFRRAVVFNQPLSSWDVNSVVNMSSMFESAEVFNQPLDTWNVSAVANMSSMFQGAMVFDQPLNSWDVTSVTLMPSMFERAELFNGEISNWNVASVTNMREMFKDAIAFNQSIENWDTGEVLTMAEMFRGATNFNRPINSWNTSFVTTMEGMFEEAAAFDQPINSWNVASVTTMEKMFKEATVFDQDINSWNVRGVNTMEEMFRGASTFNQSLNNWRVAGVGTMQSMFEDAIAYNQVMDQWDLGTVNLNAMFNNATALNQNLGDWDVSGVNDMQDMLDNTALSRENYDNTLIAWSEQTLTSGITMGADGLPYCDALEERQSMIDTYGWTIENDVLDCPVPECTVLASPLSGATDVPVNTNLTWEPSLFARGYRLTVGTASGANDILDDVTVNDTTYEFGTDFNTGDTVYVTIIPFNDEGDAVGPCTEESFSISSDPATIPECTALTLPLNNDTDVAITTDLSWTPIANADGYRLAVGMSTGASDIMNLDVNNVTTFDLTNDLPENTEIFVTITPYNDEGDAIGCTEESFTTELIPVPPVCTSLISPANNETNVAIDTNLSWTAVSNATGYLVIVGTTSGGIEIVNNVDVGPLTNFDIPEDLRENRSYYVTIIPYNDEGDAIGCIEETFRTGNSSSPPSCVLLAAPANGSTGVAPNTNLSWNGSSSATGYRLTVGTTQGGTEIFTDDLGDVTVHDLASDLPESTMIYVTVTAYNINGDATGCTEESFMTGGPPLCTTLVSPANLDTNVAVDVPNISWNPSPNADGYRVTVTASNSTANNQTNLDITSGTTHNFTNDFVRGETVTVTVVPYNGLGNAIGCTSETFTIVPPPVPLCTTLVTPADGTIDVALDTSLEWNPSTGADGYKLTVLASNSTENNLTDFEITSGTTYNFANDFEQGETVTVTIVPYNTVGDAIGCTSESFTVKPIPACTNLTTPTNGAVDIAVDTNIEWTAISDAIGYKLTIEASSSTSNNLTNEIVVTGTTYNFSNNFEQGETVSVTITPYNEVGDAMGCTVERFTIAAVPPCTNLTLPLNEAVDVAADTNIQWQAITEAIGYKVTVSASNSVANNITELDITGTTYDFPNDFEQGETVTVTIVPYNATGDAIGCVSERFTIKSVPSCSNLVAPANGAVIAEVNEISWDTVTNANGYRLTISASNSTANNVTNLDVTDTNYIFPNDFNEGELVTVMITPYNELGDAIGCTSESFTIRPIPNCTSLIQPLNNTTAVSVNTDISWRASSDADGYRISVGTTPNGTDIVSSEDVASLTNYILAEELPSETMIYVTVVPYNSSGIAVGCVSEQFETEIIAPDCAVLSSPSNGETEVALNSSINWDAIEKTDGYRISIGTTSGGSDIVANQDMGTDTSYTYGEEFPFGTVIYVSITPYNTAGDALGCEELSFTTLIPEDETKYGFSPNGDGINDFWQIENIEYYPQNVVTIYNRWGDMVFQVQGYDNAANVFTGMANEKTNMGANKLPSGTYFFNIQIDGETILGKTQGYLVLKR